jgi:hypothetical protein
LKSHRKPTTANRYRLEAAIKEALEHMPQVYEGSVCLPHELDKFPCDGEQEMFEQEDCVDLDGEVHVSKEVFALWYASGEATATLRPCAAVVCRYTVDQQGLDFRGSVSADTSWDLCCRLLSLLPEQNKLGTRDLAQLLVYWLEEGHVPRQMAHTVYDGMEADLRARNKTNVTVEDDQRMKCRWVRQSIHAELDANREECAARGEGLPVDFEVDGEIAQNLQQPANAEATQQATMLLQDLRAQGTTPAPSGADVPWADAWDNDVEQAVWSAGALEDPVAADVALDDHACPLPQTNEAGAPDCNANTPSADAVLPGKPLVEAPEFGDRVRDTDKDPYWIPGAFPNIFQNQTGDLHNAPLKEPDMLTWGPHIMRSRGWHAQAHMTFCYWWLNMLQRTQVLSAKKWYVRDNPKATGYTCDDIRGMSVRTLAKNMVGYTANIPGTRASKSKLRRIILTMVKQIEIETTEAAGAENAEVVPGDVPSLFGTLTTQRYHWDDIIRIIAMVEQIENYKDLSKSKQRALVNKYPLFVAWYGAVRLELILKTVVVPLYGASSYVSVFEWSPTGGMVHLHYILWKRGAPRFDTHAEDLLEKAKALRKAGLVAGGEVTCDIKYVVDFFADYVTEWNPNKTPQGEEKTSHVAEQVNETLPHTASLSTQEMLELLRSENPHARYAYYERAVRTEHLHDFHYPDPTGPPNPAQPCAQLLKGTLNMWYCGNGYPRELVSEPCDRSVAQDALRSDLWRVNLCRNCQVMNPHIPLVPFAIQSNSDGTPVATRHQAEMYCCKYCSKWTKGKGQKSALYEVIDDMERKDAMAQEKFGESYEESKLGGKLHRAFMAEVGVEMCQAEVAHHTNKMPEYLISRDVKEVHLYKKALAINKQATEKADEEWPWGDEEEEAQETLATRPSDVDLYERRTSYLFWPKDTLPSPHLPQQPTPEEQVRLASLWDFFRLVRFKGGRNPHLQWHDPAAWPIVVISPVVKLTEGPDFAFGARWALMQHRAWTDRRYFLDMPDEEVKIVFRGWRLTGDCPWHIRQQYLQENGRRARAGAGPAGKRSKDSPNSDSMEPAEYEAKLAALVEAKDYAGAAALQYQRRLALESEEVPRENDDQDDAGASGEEENPGGSETEHSSSADEKANAAADADTHVLKMLYKGNMTEISREEQQSKKAQVHNSRHNCYRNTRCTSVAQEEQSALPAGVINTNEDSDDDEAYLGDQKEITKEIEELRVAQHWVNQEGWDVASEAHVPSKSSGKVIDLHLDWGAVQRTLADGHKEAGDSDTSHVDEGTVLSDHSLEKLDPTQRVFADRVLKWASKVADVYDKVRTDGRHRTVPLLRSFLGGSAGSGKSTTLKTIVQHTRLMFEKRIGLWIPVTDIGHQLRTVLRLSINIPLCRM